MGLNDLLHHHQESLMRADAAACDAVRSSHRRLALGYARRIADLVGPARSGLPPLVPLA